MVDLNPQFQALLDNQLQMNPQTWAALQGRGVDERTLLIIDFGFTAKGKAEAKGLTSFLREKTAFSATARAERGTAFASAGSSAAARSARPRRWRCSTTG